MKKLYPFLIMILFFLLLYGPIQAQWVKMTSPFFENISCLAANETDVFAGTPYGVFWSSDNGANWKSIGPAEGVDALGLSGQNLFTSTSSGLYLSTYDGDKWTVVKTNFPSNEIAIALKSLGSRIYAGTKSGSVFLSTDEGKDWSSVNNGIDGTVQTFAVIDTTLFAGSTDGLYVNISDTAWDKIDSGLNDSNVKALTSSGSNIYALAGYNVYRSTDGGKSWSKVNNSKIFVFGSKIAAIGSNLFVGSSSFGLFMSTDGGKTWANENKEMPDQWVKAFAVSGNNLYLGTDIDGVFLSTNKGASWNPVNHGLPTNNITSMMSIEALGASDSTIFAGTQIGVYRSVDSAKSWTKLENGLLDPQVETIAVYGKTIYVGTYSKGIFESNDNGDSWTQINNGLTNYEVMAILSTGNELYAGTYGSGVFKSTDGGEIWTAINSGMSYTNVISLAKSGTDLFAGTAYKGVFLSTDDGKSWTTINSGLTKLDINSLVFYTDKLFAGVYNGGVFQAVSNGTDWKWMPIDSGLVYNTIYKLIPLGKSLFAETQFGMCMLPSYGSSWIEIDDGLSYPYPIAFAISNTSLYVGLMEWNDEIWRRPISQLVTGVNKFSDNLSQALSLFKNYPNPFYDKTVIEYKLPVKGTVDLSIFNSKGQKVATLVNDESQTVGTHKVSWNGGNLPKGTYFYRLTEKGSRNITEAKAMVLMK